MGKVSVKTPEVDSPVLRTPSELEAYKARVQKRIEALLPIFGDLALGEIGKKFEIPDADDEFSELYVGIATMLEVIQDQFQELKDLNQSLETAVSDRSRDLLQEIEFSQSLLKAQSDLGVGVAILDGASRKFIYVNDAMSQICGYASEELLAMPSFLNVIAPSELPVIEKRLNERLAGKKVADHYETVLVRKTGRHIPIEVAVKKTEKNNGSRLVVIIRDITHRKNIHAELERRVDERTKELRQSEHMLELAHDAIVVTDLTHRIRFWNKGAEKKYGFSKEEAHGKVMHDLLATEFPEHRALIEEQARSKSGWEGEIRQRRKIGEWITVSSRWVLLDDPTTGEALFLKINRDITRQKEMEADLKFLAQISEILASSLHYETTLHKLAKAVVPYFADWCAIDILDADGRLKRVATEHPDPRKVALALELQKKFPPDPNESRGVYHVIATQQAEIMEEIPESLLIASAKGDPEKIALLKDFPLKSYICVPLIAHDRTLGAITFCMAESPRRYNAYDLSFSYEIARRAAVSLDNAQAHTELEQRVEARTQDLRKAIDELRANEKSLRKWGDIFEHARWGLLVGSPDGKRFEMMNPAFAQMVGYSVSELTNQPIEILIPDEFKAEHFKNVEQIRKTGHLVWETMVLKKTKEMFPVRIDLTVVKDQSGTPLHYIGSIQDITAEKIADSEVRKAHEDLEIKVRLRTRELQEVNELLTEELQQRERAESALREAHLKTAAILGSITDAYVRFDLKWNVRDLNRQAEILLGCTRTQLLGRNFWKEFPNVKKDRFFAQYGKAIESQSPTHFESYLSIADKWFEVHAYPSTDGLSVYLRDITARKVAEEALKNRVVEIEQAQVKNEAILESIGEAMVAVDTEGRIMFLNREAESMWNLKSAQAAGKPIAEAAPLVNLSGQIVLFHKRPLGVSIRTGKRIVNSALYLKKGERKIPLSITATPIVFAGKAIGAIGVYRDITKEREVERAKSDFVALASHQLRTPLTITSWYAEKLLSDERPLTVSEQKGYLEELYKANGRMRELVDALLDVSRIEAGVFEIHPKPLRITDVADSVLEEHKVKIEAKKLSVFKYYDKRLGSVNTDERLLRIIFQNIFGNAVKYTDEGGTVTLLVQKQDLDILIVVEDTGYGIPESAHAKVFHKLFRADNARERESDGSGLGLYIVKSIVDQVGGHIWFESEEGKGTKFYVSLPAKGMPNKVAKLMKE